ncbi:phage major capsid protein [Rhizobium rhizoryzae]|uniref:HK97 family phage major capsid protein n=1 Tax=Rhizobium rhizoryzae TaxID=451876 RepID=A0A7W6LKQ7_9HYPH|nr:phage major capsid protein [Rhizobium rhizoryzae]MBB4146031.1 HK97 family phage major capsid protein [Rhizobium rhizoryzae]
MMKNRRFIAAASILGAMTANERMAGRYLRDGGGHPSAEQLAKDVRAKFDESMNAVKGIAEDALNKAKAGEALSASVKEKADEALTKLNGLAEQVAELAQKAARNQPDETASQTLGEKFTAMAEFKSMAESPRGGVSVNMPVKADITTATTDAAGSAGAGIAPTRLPGVQGLPQRRMTIRQLLTPGNTDGPLIQYVKETGFTNNAGMVAEGGLKPNSDIKLDDKDVTTKVIAHWFRASKQILSDFAQVRSMIDQRLIYGLQLKEEQQLLFGDGTGENLAGIVPQASAYAAPITLDDETSIDKIRLMMLQAVLAEYPATGIVLNPIDWAWIETLKDTTGRYIIGNPQGSIAPTLWGLPVVATQAMTVDKVLVGAFQMGAQIFDQWASRVEVGFQNDDFVKNKVTILAEERLALAVYRPESFVYGDFGRVA